MNVYKHRYIVTVISPDPNPASVAATIDTTLDGLFNAPGTHPQRRLLAVNTKEVAGEQPRLFEIPDEPFMGKPDNWEEISKHDDWVNQQVYPLVLEDYK